MKFKFLGFISEFFTFSRFDTTNSCVYFLVSGNFDQTQCEK